MTGDADSATGPTTALEQARTTCLRCTAAAAHRPGQVEGSDDHDDHWVLGDVVISTLTTAEVRLTRTAPPHPYAELPPTHPRMHNTFAATLTADGFRVENFLPTNQPLVDDANTVLTDLELTAQILAAVHAQYPPPPPDLTHNDIVIEMTAWVTSLGTAAQVFTLTDPVARTVAWHTLTSGWDGTFEQLMDVVAHALAHQHPDR